jgi:hypothetical protein
MVEDTGVFKTILIPAWLVLILLMLINKTAHSKCIQVSQQLKHFSILYSLINVSIMITYTYSSYFL